MLLDFCDLRVCPDVCDDVRSGGVGRSVGLVSGAPLFFYVRFFYCFTPSTEHGHQSPSLNIIFLDHPPPPALGLRF